MAQQWDYNEEQGWTQESYIDQAKRVWITGEDSVFNRSNKWLKTQREKPKSAFEQTLYNSVERFYEASQIGPAEDHAIEQTTKGVTDLAKRLGVSDMGSQVAGASAGFLLGMVIPGVSTGEVKALANLTELRKLNKASKSVRAQSTDLFDHLNRKVSGSKWDVLQEEGLEGIGKTQKGLNNEIIPNKQSVYYQQRVQGLSPHHLSEKSFDLRTFENLDEATQIKFLKDLNSIDVFPGNHPRNWMGMFHDNTTSFINQQKSEVIRLRKAAGMDVTSSEFKRQLHDFFKDIPEFKPSLQSEINLTQGKQRLGRDYSTILPEGKSINDLELDSFIIGRDHQDFTHGITNNLASTKRIENSLKTGEWNKLSYNEMFKLKAKNSIEKQNVAFNVGLIRINHIRKQMGDPNAPWEDVVTWIAKNPERSASAGWYETLKRGGDIFQQLGKTKKQMIADLSDEDLRLVANVFGMKDIPKSSSKLKKLLNQQSDRRSEIKAIEKDIFKGL